MLYGRQRYIQFLKFPHMVNGELACIQSISDLLQIITLYGLKKTKKKKKKNHSWLNILLRMKYLNT